MKLVRERQAKVEREREEREKAERGKVSWRVRGAEQGGRETSVFRAMRDSLF